MWHEKRTSTINTIPDKEVCFFVIDKKSDSAKKWPWCIMLGFQNFKNGVKLEAARKIRNKKNVNYNNENIWKLLLKYENNEEYVLLEKERKNSRAFYDKLTNLRISCHVMLKENMPILSFNSGMIVAKS